MPKPFAMRIRIDNTFHSVPFTTIQLFTALAAGQVVEITDPTGTFVYQGRFVSISLESGYSGKPAPTHFNIKLTDSPTFFARTIA